MDPSERLLLCKGEAVPLTPKVFDTLLVLVENAGSLVTKEEFMRRVWADAFVEDAVLTQNISQLRKVLSEGGIETVPKKGYRFLKAVEVIEVDGEIQCDGAGIRKEGSPAGPAAQVAELPHSASQLRAIVLLALGLVGVIGLVAMLVSYSSRDAPRVLGSATLTERPSVDGWGRLNTDGARIFFLKRQGDHWNLMQQPIAGGEEQPFPHPFQNARVMSVSPDVSVLLIGDFSTRGAVRLWLMPAVGGEPRPVGNIVAQDAVFTPDGHHVAYSTEDGIFVSGLGGEDSKQIFTGAGAKSSLSWRPDGRSLRFTWNDPAHPGLALWEIGERGNNPHLVLPRNGSPPDECCGRWSPDGRYYFFASNRSGLQSIWVLQEKAGWWRRRQREPLQLTFGPLGFSEPLPNGSGTRLFALGLDSRQELARYSPHDRQMLPLLSGHSAFYPNYSPDHEWMVYQSGANLWISHPDGRNRRQLTSGAFAPQRPKWSPAGNEILYLDQLAPRAQVHLYTIAAAGGAPRHVDVGHKSLWDADWSPDGKSIVFAVGTGEDSASEDGLYLLVRTGAQIRRIPGGENLTKPRFSPDGRYLAAESSDEKRILLLDINKQQWREVRQGKVFGPLAWSRDSGYVYFQDVLENDEPIWRMSVRDGHFDRVADFHTLLEGGVLRCGFEELAPDDTPIVRITRGENSIYAFDLELP